MPNIEDGITISENADINLVNKLLEMESNNSFFIYKIWNKVKEYKFGYNIAGKDNSFKELNKNSESSASNKKNIISSIFSNTSYFLYKLYSIIIFGNKEKSV